jgi:hydrogenase-4 component B
MGGLGARMPWSALLTLGGAAAICGLPPFNGFASEFLLYLGFFGEARSPQPYLALGAPVLALVGGVALIAFVKLMGFAFLGAPRSREAESSHESPPSMLVPIFFLTALCLLGGLFPQLFLALVTPVLPTLAPVGLNFGGLPFSPALLTLAGGCVLALSAALFCYLRFKGRGLPKGSGPTWGCGYLRPTSRIQYTASSFGAMFASLASPLIRTSVRVGSLAGLAPAAVRLSYTPEETILCRLILPLAGVAGVCFSFLRRLQHGQVQIYIFYIFATLLLLMLWVR